MRRKGTNTKEMIKATIGKDTIWDSGMLRGWKERRVGAQISDSALERKR